MIKKEKEKEDKENKENQYKCDFDYIKGKEKR